MASNLLTPWAVSEPASPHCLSGFGTDRPWPAEGCGGFALTVGDRACPGWRAQAELVRFLLDAPGPEHVVHRAVTALGLLPQVAWAELVRDGTTANDPAVRAVSVASRTQAHRRIVVRLAEPCDREDLAFVESLLDLVARIYTTAEHLRRLSDDAHTDPLTGLWNRRAFFALFDKAVARLDRGGDDLALLLCDIDHFKTINDTLGHAAGDRALLAVRDAVARVTRPSDVAARLGGDEICILLSGTDVHGAVKVANRLRDALRDENPLTPTPLTLSIGAADPACVPRGSSARHTRADLLRAADEALYRAKARGRDCVVPAQAPDPLDRCPTTPIDVEPSAA